MSLELSLDFNRALEKLTILEPNLSEPLLGPSTIYYTPTLSDGKLGAEKGYL